jgi:hypothetical protein
MTSWTWARVLVVGAATFVVGFVVGGVGPRGELRAAEAENFELQRKGGRGAGSGELSRILTGRLGPEGVERGGRAPGGAFPPAADDAATPGDEIPGPEEQAGEDEVPDLRSRGDAQAALREAIAARAAQARAALTEDADPSPQQLARIDAAYAEMNDALDGLAREFVQRTRDGEPMGRREMMAFGADLLDVLVTAEDKVLGSIEADQRSALREEASDPTSYVDARIVDMISELEGWQP